MSILAAFALLHPDHHAPGIDVADLQRDHLHGAQCSAIGNAERRLVLGPGRVLQQAQHLFGREHARQLARLVDDTRWRVVSGRSSVTLKRNRSVVTVALMLGGCAPVSVRCSWNARSSSAVAVSGTAEEDREPLDGTDTLALPIGHEPAHVDVFEHALAQRADGILAHAPVLRLEC